MLAFATMKIVELSPREDYGLFLRYEDGTEGVVDLSSMADRRSLQRGWYPEFLNKPSYPILACLSGPGNSTCVLISSTSN